MSDNLPTIFDLFFFLPEGKAQIRNVEFFQSGQEGWTDHYDPRYSAAFLNLGEVQQHTHTHKHDKTQVWDDLQTCADSSQVDSTTACELKPNVSRSACTNIRSLFQEDGGVEVE